MTATSLPPSIRGRQRLRPGQSAVYGFIEARYSSNHGRRPWCQNAMVVIACRDSIAIEPQPSDAAPQPDPLIIPFTWQPQGRRKGVAHEPSTKPRLDHEAGQTLLIAIAKARSWMAGLINGTISSTYAIAAREQMGERNVRKLLPLACISPQVIQAIVDGHAPADLTIRSLTAALPHHWVAQHQRFLIA